MSNIQNREYKTFIKEILQADNAKLKKLNIKQDRYDVIKSGSLILETILERFSCVNDIVTSGVGVREGVYLSDLLRNSKD